MSDYLISREELKEMLTQAAAEGARLALKNASSNEEWLTAAEAMALIKCGTTKLYNLEVERRVVTNGSKRFEKRFSKSSINKYISNGK